MLINDCSPILNHIPCPLCAHKETRSVYVNVQINFATSACTKRGCSFENVHTANWRTQPPYVFSEINYRMGCLTTNPCNQTSDATVTQYNSRPCDNIVFQGCTLRTGDHNTTWKAKPTLELYVHSVEAQIWTFQIYLTKFQVAIKCVSASHILDTWCALRSGAPVCKCQPGTSYHNKMEQTEIQIVVPVHKSGQ